MPVFGKRSTANLNTCTPGIVAVLNKGIERADFTVLCGHRGEAAQDAAFAGKRSTKQWPDSEHNEYPSPAADVAPWYRSDPYIDWRTDTALWAAVSVGDTIARDSIMENIKRWFALIHYLLGVGDGLGIELRSGGDWDMDFEYNDQRLIDLPHLEEV